MDFEHELQIAQANADMAPDVETVFLPTASKFGFVTASLVREIASHGGNVSRYVPANVVPVLTAKFVR
jgi:pantetheine-phosphate adenylyltransferase